MYSDSRKGRRIDAGLYRWERVPDRVAKVGVNRPCLLCRLCMLCLPHGCRDSLDDLCRADRRVLGQRVPNASCMRCPHAHPTHTCTSRTHTPAHHTQTHMRCTMTLPALHCHRRGGRMYQLLFVYLFCACNNRCMRIRVSVFVCLHAHSMCTVDCLGVLQWFRWIVKRESRGAHVLQGFET